MPNATTINPTQKDEQYNSADSGTSWWTLKLNCVLSCICTKTCQLCSAAASLHCWIATKTTPWTKFHYCLIIWIPMSMLGLFFPTNCEMSCNKEPFPDSAVMQKKTKNDVLCKIINHGLLFYRKKAFSKSWVHCLKPRLKIMNPILSK